MDTPTKNLTNDEKENVLLVLNEFSEEYNANHDRLVIIKRVSIDYNLVL